MALQDLILQLPSAPQPQPSSAEGPLAPLVCEDHVEQHIEDHQEVQDHVHEQEQHWDMP